MTRPNSLLKHLFRTLPLLAAAASFFLSCGDSSATNPTNESRTLRYQNEAEQMALVVQGTLRPSEWLTKQINDELVLIRDTWGDSIPAVNEAFQPPWIVSLAGIKVDTSLYIEITNGANAEFNQLLEETSVYIRDPHYTFSPRSLILVSDQNLHPVRMAEYFAGFPGIIYVQTRGIWFPVFHAYARKVVGDTIRYYFSTSLCPDLYDEYFYIEIAGDSANLRDRFAECWGPDNWPDLPFREAIELFDAWVDSAEANRPYWVDEARTEIGNVLHYKQFNWQRE